MSTKTPTSTCKYFQQGNCTRGDKCQFRHGPSSLGTTTGLSSPKICQHFQHGSCRYGNRCRDKHVDGPPTVKTHDPEVRTCTFFLKGACAKGSACPYLHDSSSDSIKSDLVSPFGVCKFFSQGRCTKGEICPFPHEAGATVVRRADKKTISIVNPESRDRSASANVNEAIPMQHISTGDQDIPKIFSTTERNLLGASVIFGPGASIELVTTAFESCRVDLSNLPLNISQSDLVILLEPFGHLKSVTLHKTSSTAAALIEFETPRDADYAVAELNRTQIRSCKLVARLALRAGERGTAILRSCKVKISWYVPSFVAWAHYSTIFSAREAQRKIDGQLFNGRKIAASFQAPSLRQTESFSVEIKGMPAWINVKEFRQFSGADSITLGHPSYRREDAVLGIRRVLETFGHLDTFDILPSGKLDAKIKAFAQFSSAEAAANAVKALHNVPQGFLRRGPLFMEIIHSVKYSVASQHFEIIKGDVDGVRSRPNECKIRYYDRDENGCKVNPVCVRIYGTDPKSLGRVKAELDRLLNGQVFTSDGIEVWDDYFDTKQADSFFHIVSDDCRAFVGCDRRNRRLKLFGRDICRSSAQERILKKIKEMKSQRHIIPLDISLLRKLMTGGLAEVENALEGSKVIFDVVSRTLTVHGGSQVVKKAERSLAVLSHSTVTHSSNSADCPVCFCEVDDSTKLACGHSYCTPCLKHFLKSAPDTKAFPVQCVAVHDGRCNTSIALSVIRDLMSSNDEGRVLEASFLYYIHKQPETYRYCPTPDCPIIYRPGPQGTALRCPACLVHICPSCHVEFHEGLTCREHLENVSGESAFRQWRLENNVKACPKCNADIEKNGGCNHITCARCRSHICWVCMAMFTDEDSGGGVYAHMRKVHGGIGS